MGQSPSKERNSNIAIVVEQSFEIFNGLLGLKRDLIFRLLCKMNEIIGKNIVNRNKVIRAIIGMDQGNLEWRKRKIFKLALISGIGFFLPTPHKKCVLAQTPAGPLCTFVGDEYGRIFVDKVIFTGIFRWDVKVRYNVESGRFQIGSATALVVSSDSYDQLGTGGGGCAFDMWKFKNEFRSCLQGIDRKFDFPTNEIPVPDGAIVAVETNFTRVPEFGHGLLPTLTLTFFVNGQKVPRGIYGIPAPFYLGASGKYSSFTSLSFRHLASPTITTTITPATAASAASAAAATTPTTTPIPTTTTAPASAGVSASASMPEQERVPECQYYPYYTIGKRLVNEIGFGKGRVWM